MSQRSGDELFRCSWDGKIVLLSVSIAFVGSYGAITLYEQYRLCSKENAPKILNPSFLIILMAIALGGVAIWCMHFIGMSALTLTDPHGFPIIMKLKISHTAISLVSVVLLSYLGFVVSSRDKMFVSDKKDAIDRFIKDARKMSIEEIRKIKHKNSLIVSTLFKGLGRLVVGGTIAASGVCVMHYLGMEACVFPGFIIWSPGVVFASVVVAIVAASAAFWILFRLLSVFPNTESLRLSCAIIMSIAVSGVHYIGMGAATFVYDASVVTDVAAVGATVDVSQAVSIAVIIAVAFMFCILFLALSDLRVWFNNLASIVREADLRMKAAKVCTTALLLYDDCRFEYALFALYLLHRP